MIRITEVIRNGVTWGWRFHCPACQGSHQISLSWDFNGDRENPTIKPSIRVRGMGVCHMFVTDGKIQYLSDCTHEYAGKTIEMVDVDGDFQDLIQENNDPVSGLENIQNKGDKTEMKITAVTFNVASETERLNGVCIDTGGDRVPFYVSEAGVVYSGADVISPEDTGTLVVVPSFPAVATGAETASV